MAYQFFEKNHLQIKNIKSIFKTAAYFEEWGSLLVKYL